MTCRKCAEEVWCWFCSCSIHTDRRRWCATSLFMVALDLCQPVFQLQ